MTDAVIVGGGAAGLAAACALTEAERSVVLLEKQSRVGRKLLATGNGRCNLTHVNASPAQYHGATRFAERALMLCPPSEVLSFFEALGVPCVVDEEGRAYPMSNQAASVLDALRLAAAEKGCEIVTDCAVTSVMPNGRGWTVKSADGRAFSAKNALVCTGGLAAPKLGACGDGYKIMEALGHPSTPKFPAIAALKTPADAVRGLKGQRVSCGIALRCDGKFLRSESGEVLFAEDGLSGIAAMQLARACGEALRNHKKCEAVLSILPKGGAEALSKRVERLPKRSMDDFLNGIVPKRVGQMLAKTAGIEPLTREAGSLTRAEIERLGGLLERWAISVTAVQGFDQAQVTAGGVSLKDFDPDTMESKKCRGLYIAGELADVDGDCGGYNLQWAWSSALIAARSMKF